jgi:ABC-type transport system involved in cytochrome c biogenesis permease subunit
VPWRECFLHIFLALTSYALFFAAAIGSVSFLIVQSYAGFDEIKQFKKTMQDYRRRLNFFYIVIGFVFLTASIGLGSYYSKIFWGSYLTFDSKEVFTGIVWLFYLAIVVLSIYSLLRKNEKINRLTAVLTITGLLFLLTNALIVTPFMSALHKHF